VIIFQFFLGIPPRIAAASLKQILQLRAGDGVERIPPRIAAASLKRVNREPDERLSLVFRRESR